MALTGYAVLGYKDLIKGLKEADKESRRDVRASFRRVGDLVKFDAARRMAPVDTRAAAGYRTSVRQSGVWVGQSVRKTSGKHPEFGYLQMRIALRPAVAANMGNLDRALEHALDEVCERFNRGGSF